ncbi:AfsR/SARP family transcriptional regulator [[Kitasatospora] papulosa]|uniref:AfsR/SARP family transcriptional regulator n=1 Tax=[Kitasatospora] papulosa TaxID=1464011 RepID=UPI003694A23F
MGRGRPHTGRLPAPGRAGTAGRRRLRGGGGRRALTLGDPARACEELDRALGLWRGAFLEGLPLSDALDRWAGRLEERRWNAEEDYAEALIAEDRCPEAVLRMRGLVEHRPLRLGAWLHLMLGLFRGGDVAGALEAHRRAREVLVRETGLEPGPELESLHRDILRQRPVPARATPAPVAPRPRQLPLVTAGFVGRDAALAALDSSLGSGSGGPGTAAITAVSGMAGVGKTALVLHWAHGVADRFPDGQLHVNLRGYDEEGPLPAADALRGFIEALGVPQARIPSGTEARTGLFRSLLASRRVLVVLDNARDSAHARPLLPGAGESVVVVTSRERMHGLVTTEGARPLTLDVLTEQESTGLLVRRLGGRIAAEPAAAAEIVAATGRLPLALAVVAARVADHPSFSLQVFAAELRPAGALLNALEDGDARRILSWSALALTDGAARLFRLLGLHPGPDLPLDAAAALAGAPEPAVRPLLRELTRLHLLTEHSPGRYLFHDLLRAYAADLVRTSEPPAARGDALESCTTTSCTVLTRRPYSCSRSGRPSRPCPGCRPTAESTSGTPTPPSPGSPPSTRSCCARWHRPSGTASRRTAGSWPGHSPPTWHPTVCGRTSAWSRRPHSPPPKEPAIRQGRPWPAACSPAPNPVSGISVPRRAGYAVPSICTPAWATPPARRRPCTTTSNSVTWTAGWRRRCGTATTPCVCTAFPATGTERHAP